MTSMADAHYGTEPDEEQLVLASSSPRRVELLGLLAPRFEVLPPGVDEGPVRSPEDLLREARRKAHAVREKVPRGIVVAADTGVFRDGRAFGKPRDRAEAAEFLRALSGGWHSVWTGLVVARGSEERSELVETRVLFAPLSEDEITAYIAAEDVLDKAGAYAIQGRAAPFVERIEGDFYNVVGLPLASLYRLLKAVGWHPRA